MPRSNPGRASDRVSPDLEIATPVVAWRSGEMVEPLHALHDE